MGTVVPSGRVVAVGPAVKLITCWPKPAAVAERRSVLTRTTAFSEVFNLESHIRIIVVASRCLSILETKNLEFSFAAANSSWNSRSYKAGVRLSLVRFVNRKFP
jgi:hypothetical protein